MSENIKWVDYLRQDTQALTSFLEFLLCEKQRILEIEAKSWDEYNKLLGSRIALDNLVRFVTMAENEELQRNYYLGSVTGNT